jgi:mono/diheme cytochrome c family protein
MRGIRLSAVLFVLALVAAACGDSADTTAAPEATTTAAATEATTTASAVSDEQLAVAAAVGDIAAGEELFEEPVAEMPDSVSCTSCHSLDGKDSPWAPGLAGISAVAADRVGGMSAVDYLGQSIVDPSAFRVDGEWRFAMPLRYSDALSEEQINNLIAFMLTL